MTGVAVFIVAAALGLSLGSSRQAQGAGLPIATTATPEHTWSIASDGNSFLVGLQHGRDSCGTGECGTGAALVSPSGRVLATAFVPRLGDPPYVGFDGTNYLLVWAAPVNGVVAAYGQLVNTQGALVGGPFVVSESTTVRELGGIAFDGTRYLVVWTDTRRVAMPQQPGDNDVYGRFVSTAGAPSGNDFKVSDGAGKLPTLAFGTSDYLVVWNEDVGDTEVRGRFVSPGGALQPAFTINGSIAPSDSADHVAFDGSNFLVVWVDIFGGSAGSDVFGQIVSPAATLVGSPIPIATEPGGQGVPYVAFDGSNYLVGWSDIANDTDGDFACDAGESTCIDVHARYVSPSGDLDAPKFAVTTDTDNQVQAAVACAAGRCLFAWTDRFDTPAADVFGRLFDIPTAALIVDDPLVAPGGDAGDRGGFALASNDDYVVMGAPDAGSGAVYVFQRTGSALRADAKFNAGLVATKDVVPVATLTNAGGGIGDKWGSAVSISPDGSVIAIGAPAGAGGSGAAHTFVRPTGGNWQTDDTPTASLAGSVPGDGFGSAVALGAGGMMAVGAPGADGGQGRAQVFGSTGTPIGAPLGPDLGSADAGTNFGASLAMSGGQLVIGSPGENAGGRADSGAVRLYDVGESAVGAPTSLAPAGGAAVGDKWGSAVAISGGTVVGGSPGAAGGNGAGYVFQDTGGGMTRRGVLTGGSDATGAAVGTSVAVAGDYVLLGGPLADVGGRPDQGRAFVFLQDELGWSDQVAAASFTSGAGAGDDYGRSVTLSSRGAAIGIPNRDVAGQADQGQAASFVLDRIFRATFE